MQHFGGVNLRKVICRIMGVFILFPMMLWASSATVSWQTNIEVDLAGYKIYYGIQSGVYSVIINVGNVTEYPIL